jgi:hypothetical protein
MQPMGLNDFGRSIVSKLVANGFDVNCLRTNATLRKDEWIMLDTMIIQTARQRLRAAADLMSRGLVKNVNGLATTILQWQTQSRTGEVNVNIDPQVQGNSEALDFQLKSLPLPIFHADYQIGLRELTTSRNNGFTGLDTLLAAQKAQDIAEKIENTLINGLDNFTYGQGTIYGYTDFPDRATTTISDWSDTAVTGEDIVQEVLEMVQAQFDQFSYGPFVLYIPLSYATKMSEDYSDAKGDNTIRERIEDIQEVSEVRVLDLLEDGNVLLVQLTQDKVEMVNGMPLSNVQWDEGGGMTSHFKIMTIQIPRLLADKDGNSGICHGQVVSPSP